MALTNRKLPNPTCVKHIGDVIAAILIVTLYSKTGQQRRSLNSAFSDSQSVAVVGLADGSSVVRYKVETVAEGMFISYLCSVVVRVTVLSHVVHVGRKVRIGDELRIVGPRRQELARLV